MGSVSVVRVIAARMWAGMSSGPSASCSYSADSGAMRSAQRCKSRSTAGSAFSCTTRDALVCWTKTVHKPLRTPARATARRTWPVTSCSPRPSAGTSTSSWWTFTRTTLHPRRRPHFAVGGGPLGLAQRLQEGLAERFEIVRLAARDPVLVDDDLLVLDVRARLLEVALDRRPRRHRPAAHQARAEEQLRTVADRRQRALRGVEPLDEVDEPLVDAQVIRRLAARDEQAQVVLRP